MTADSAISSAAIETFYARVAERFSLAANAVGTRTLDFCIAGRVVRLVFAGDALVSPLTRALQHLALEPQPSPDLNIRLWEVADTGVPLPPPPWGSDAYTF